MENRFKLRISRMFRSSFGSCKSQNISDIIEKPVFVSHQKIQCVEPSPPRLLPFPSICKPRCPKTETPLKNNSTPAFPRQKVSERHPLFFSADIKGRMCPPASPISPLNMYYKFNNFESDTSKKKKKRRVKKNKRREVYNFFTSSSSSEEENEREMLFSSKSTTLSSASSDRAHRTRHRRKADGSYRRRNDELGVLPIVQGSSRVKDSFAVVKRSRDPHSDFRTSMVEMIVEKQIFLAKDLEQLLQCFLSLNSSHHHKVIVEVFTEIWEALF